MLAEVLPSNRHAHEPVSSQAVIASMRQHGIPFTADNYAVWHCYLTAQNPVLKRAIDMVLSNGLAMDDRALRALYTRHFSQARGALSLQAAASRAGQTIAALKRALGPQRADSLLDALEDDVRDIARQSEQMTRHLSQSEERVAQLEHCLEDARQEASTDGLTGLANRRAFDAALRIKAGDAMNDGAELAFVLVDIDHFKQVNDRWGHSVGDDVLRMIASTLIQSVSHGALVARYGGEEFAIILPGAVQDEALSVAENLRIAIERRPLTPTANTISAIRVTVSAGISCYDHGETLAGWLARADRALYRAKNAGRNRVQFGGLQDFDNVLPMAARTQPSLA